jgi:hypothetical protein
MLTTLKLATSRYPSNGSMSMPIMVKGVKLNCDT